jgi:hypothetical protein
MYHPAAALHQPALKPDLEKDFARLSEWIAEAKKTRPTAAPTPEKPTPVQKDEPTQLSLF